MRKYRICYWKYKNDQWQDFGREIEALSLDQALATFRKNNPSVRIDEIKLVNDIDRSQQERDKSKYLDLESFENKSLKWWMSLSMDEQVKIGFKYDMPTFNLSLRAIMFEYEQFKKK